MKNNNVEIPFEAKGSKLDCFEYTIPNGYEAEIKNGKVIVRKADSEDEKIRKGLIEFVRYYGDKFYSQIAKGSAIAWLEKQGIENAIKNDAVHLCNELIETIADLKEKQGEQEIKIVNPKFRVGDVVKSLSQPMLQPRKITSIDKDGYWTDNGFIGFAWEKDCELVNKKLVEWSEEDKKMLGYAIKAVHYMYVGKDHNSTSELYCKVANWLKSLKDMCFPQLHWKPSEEQMGALCYAYCELFKRGENGEGANCVHHLSTLIDELKKL